MPPVPDDQHYRSIFEGSLDAILLIDPADGRVLAANGAALSIYADESLVGRSLIESAGNPEEARERLERVIRDGALRFEVAHAAGNGRELHMEVNATATTFGDRPAILSIMRDITERVLAARALSTSEERMRTVLENVSASVWTLNERHQMVFLAGRLQALGGQRADELTIEQATALWIEAVDPGQIAKILELQRKVFASGEGYDIEYPFRRADGSRGWLNDRASAPYEREGVRYVDGATFDITERKEIEIQQRDAAEFGRRSVRVQDLDALFADACSTVLYVMSCDTVAFFRHDPVERHFVQVALAGRPMDKAADAVSDTVEHAGGFAFAGTRPVAFDDLHTETRFRSPVMAANGIRSGIVAPVRGRTIAVGGMIAVSQTQRKFSDREMAFVQTIANAVAEAVERIQAETGLRRHQAQLADAQAMAHIGSFELDLSNGDVEWSDELYRIVGLEPRSRKLTLEGLSAFMDATVAQRIIEGTIALPENGTFEREHTMFTVDGVTRFVHTRATRLPAWKGEHPKLFGTVQDITAQRLAENALREREARLELIVSRLPVIIWSTDEQMQLTSIAGAGFAAIAEDWVRELDLKLDQLLGVPRDTEARAADALSGEPVQYEVSNGTRELRVHVEPLRDGQGMIIGTVGIAFDRTSQNRTERVLSQIAQGVVSDIGESFFASAVASLADALHADVVFIAERTGVDGGSLRTIAVHSDGDAGDELLYSIGNTPCEQVLRDGFVWIDRGARRAFPDDAHLDAMKIESYAGAPILDSRGEAIGLVSMMNRRSFPRDAAAEAALRIYADRASAELDRVRRERSLHDAKNYVENLIDSANVLIIENDLEGRVRLVNRAFERLTGRSRADVVDTPVAGLFADNLDGWRPGALGEQETESSLLAADGTKRIISLRTNEVRRDGEVVGTIFFGIDVTEAIAAAAEQERLQQQVLAAAAEWRNTFDSVVAPIVIVDAEGRLTRVNHAATRLTERSFQELVGSGIDTLADAEPWTTAAGIVRRMRDSRLRAAVEEARDPRGRTWNISAVPLGGTGSSVILVLSDISGIVDLQESLRESERMSAMGRLVAGVAHEVRNPLFGISAVLDAFEVEFGQSPDVAEYVERLRSDADRLRRLMNDLLEYGRPAVLTLERQPFARVIEQSLRVCEPETRAKNVTVRLTVAPLLTDVTIDHDRILQVLKNVIENATGFTAAGSEVTVDVRGEEGFVVCSIADQGPGFRAEDIAHVFEPFFTRRRGGTGLGLAIVQRIIGDHGGTVSVRNGDAGGAIVELRLPV